MYDNVSMHGTPGTHITLGESLQRVEIDDLIITETAHEPNRVLPWHCHAHANVAFVLNGSFTEVVERHR